MNERRLRFAEAYAKSGNATKAAIEAGYKPHSAHVTGYRLLRKAEVQEIIDSKLIKRDVHAEQTYRDLILVAAVALEELKNAREAVRGKEDVTRLHRSTENARKCLETLGKAEGLFIQRVEHSGEIKGGENHILVNVKTDPKTLDDEINSRLSILGRLKNAESGNGTDSRPTGSGVSEDARKHLGEGSSPADSGSPE